MISDQEMDHLKTLARMDLSDEETHAMKEDISKLLAYFDQLQTLDTSAVEALSRPVDMVNVFREDVQRPSLAQEEALSLGLEQEEGMFKVPRTVD